VKASGVRPPPVLKVQRDIAREPRSPRRSSPRRSTSPGHRRLSRVRLHTPKSTDADGTSPSTTKRCVTSAIRELDGTAGSMGSLIRIRSKI
jgi:hypothetical protein